MSSPLSFLTRKVGTPTVGDAYPLHIVYVVIAVRAPKTRQAVKLSVFGNARPIYESERSPRYKSPLLFRVSPQFLRKTPLVWCNCSPLFCTNGANVSFVLNFVWKNVCVFADECLILHTQDAK